VNSPNEPQMCILGDGKIALRKVGKKGYCADHHAEAYAEARGTKNVPIRQLLDDVEEPEFLGPNWRPPRSAFETVKRRAAR
jgi:hypothetical protein